MDNPKDKPAQQKPDLSRRSLLKAAPLGAIAVAAAATGRAEAAPVGAAPAPEPEAKPAGYHETEHIRTYYRTTAYW
jgi:hypothetical protein